MPEAPQQPASAPSALRLTAQDAEDIAVVSAIMQDAIVLANELRFDRLAGQFGLILQRYRWEAPGDSSRINCRLNLDGVSGLASTNPCTSGPLQSLCEDPALSLLAITMDDAGDGASTLTFTFAGNTRLRLLLKASWRLRLEDFGEPWPAPRPAPHTADSLDRA